MFWFVDDGVELVPEPDPELVPDPEQLPCNLLYASTKSSDSVWSVGDFHVVDESVYSHTCRFNEYYYVYHKCFKLGMTD